MRIVFMGTPYFVVPVLDALVDSQDADVVGVYTPPDRPRGRGRSPEMPPVKARTLSLGLPVYQPATLRSAQVQEELASLQPDVIVVAAYGKILPSRLLDLPPHGCLNLHPSLLPQHRGPSPVVTTILEGDSITGVTLMRLDQGMDTGPIIAQREHPVSPDDTAETLTRSLLKLGAGLLLENLRPWVEGRLAARPQDDAQATVTRKLERSDGEVDWRLSAIQLERRRRAYTTWPGLFTYWRDQVLKLVEVAALPASVVSGSESPGTVVSLPQAESPVGVATSDGVLGLKTLQLEGRRATTAQEFVRGYPQFVGSRL
jgi:methionyl-tRNA formyltransferase